MKGGPPPGTPLNDAWRRCVKYAEAAGAISSTGAYQRDIESERSLEPSYGFAQSYGVDPDDMEQLLLYGVALCLDAIMHGTDPANAFSAVASMFLFCGMEFKSSPLEDRRQPKIPDRHKRDVLLEFVSNPDAALNALHQAGWKVVPK